VSLGIPATITNYRIKLIGFETQVTPENLTQRFGSNNYYVDRRHDRIGYVIKIKTMKFAKQLMTKWHNKDIDGQKIKCQLEFSRKPFARYNCVRSPAGSIDEELKHYYPRSRSRDAQSSQDTSNYEDTDNIMSTISPDNGKVNRDRRNCDKALNGITQTLSKTNLHHASSSESITIEIEKKCKFLFLRG
jgi:hypothetical protein